LKLIDKYDLKSIYSINFVSQKDLDKKEWNYYWVTKLFFR
jgi:hypothetical protein